MVFLDLLHDAARAAGSVDDAALALAGAELASIGMSADTYVPSYFFDALRHLTARRATPWVALPPHELGEGWALAKLVSALPTAWDDQTADRDILGVPALGHAIVVERAGDVERYAVAPLHASGRVLDPPPRTGPSILGTLVPTDDQLRRWAYDPDLYLHTQDEEDALDAAPAPLLIQLARDPACPKRGRARAALLGQGLRAILRDGATALPRIADVAQQLRASGDPQLHGDAAAITTLHDYLVGAGPVDLDTARTIARLVLAGVHDADVTADERAGWWALATPGRERLYIHAATGALAYRRSDTLDEAGLAALGAPASRTALLGP